MYDVVLSLEGLDGLFIKQSENEKFEIKSKTGSYSYSITGVLLEKGLDLGEIKFSISKDDISDYMYMVGSYVTLEVDRISVYFN